VQQRGLAIRVACAVFSISESCYRYEPKQDAENALIADFNREALGIDVDFSLSSERVILALKQIISWRGKPKVIRCAHGRFVCLPSQQPHRAGQRRPRPHPSGAGRHGHEHPVAHRQRRYLHPEPEL
jgi:hypothetical protein